jgi:nitroreductase
MDLREALYTTRAMRRVSDEPVPPEVQARILDAAIRAPSGGNSQSWRFLLVDDPAVKAQLGPIYRACMEQLWTGYYGNQIAAAQADPESPQSRQVLRMQRSAKHLAEHFETYPLLMIAFTRNDPTGGSIFPAIWSAMLAARGEGVGTALTTVLEFRRDEVFAILGVPEGKGWNMAACITFGYPTGHWGVAERAPVETVAFRNHWGEPLGLEVNGPLWP